MVDITFWAEFAVKFATFLVIALVIPLIKRYGDMFWVNLACKAAEQLYKTGKIQDRKNYVVSYLTEKGLKVNYEDLDKMIEAAVLEINKEWSKGVAINED